MKDKKIIPIISIIVCVVIAFIVLQDSVYELSITNIQTKEKITLGETRDSIESKVGNPCDEKEFFKTVLYSYDNGNLYIVFDSNNCAAYINCTGNYYSTQKYILVESDGKEVFKKAFGKDNKKVSHKAIRFFGEAKKCKAISEEELSAILKKSGFDGIYIISFGKSVADNTVESISMGTYQTVMMGIVK